jgi:DNA repair exonuclease SbcCD ATPase subunit
MNLQQIRYRVEQLRGQRQQLAAEVATNTERCAVLKQEASYAEDARAVIQTVAQATQKQLEYHISEIVSLAMAAVFDSPYTLRLVFTPRRNKTEADIFFERDGEQFRSLDASGGGAVDVAALALRVAMWSLRRPRSRNTLILDEPGKFVSADLRPKMAAMLSEISKRLNLQLIIVSHAEEYIEAADKCFKVTIHNGVSNVVDIDKDGVYATKRTKVERRSESENSAVSEKAQLFSQVQQDARTQRQGNKEQPISRSRRRN